MLPLTACLVAALGLTLHPQALYQEAQPDPSAKVDNRTPEQKARAELITKRGILQKEDYILLGFQCQINSGKLKIKGLDQKIAVEQTDIKRLEEKKSVIEKKLADLNAQTNGNNTSNITLSEIKRKEQDIEALDKRIAKDEKIIAKHELEKGKIQEDIAKADLLFATQKAKTDLLRSELDALDKAIKDRNIPQITATSDTHATNKDKDVIDVGPAKKKAAKPPPDDEDPAGFDALTPPKK